ARVPCVVHGEHGRESTDPEGRNARRNRMRRVAAHVVDRFVTVSHDLARWLVRDVGIPAAQVTRIANGGDTDPVTPGDRPAALDVFTLSSIAEGISNTILEAMASGLPVVATRVGGNPELVDDGLTGTLVSARDERALADALAAYVDDQHLVAVRGKAGRQRA